MRAAVVATAAVLAALALVPAAATVPRAGVLVPGRTLGGLPLGATARQVLGAWGPRYGDCRNCTLETWYFNVRPFEPQGAGVEFRRGRAAALFTLGRPRGWRTPEGLRLGDPVARVTELYGALPRQSCGHYHALTARRARATTAFYVRDDELYAFGLLAPGAAVCR